MLLTRAIQTGSRAERAPAMSNLETLFSNARTYSDILRKSSLPEVGNWKEEDLDRAVHWANFFKKVHGRVSQRKSLVEKLDNKLREIGREMGMRFGGKELSLEFIANSSEYLIKVLLENPALPSDLREKVLSYVAKSETPCLTIPKVQQHLEDMKASTMLLDTLLAMHSKLLEIFPNEAVQYPGLVKVDALCLQDDIEWMLKDKQDNMQMIHQRLDAFVAEVDNGLEVILHVLLLHQSGEKSAWKFVLEWIVLRLTRAPTSLHQSDSALFSAEMFWKGTSPVLLAQVSGAHFKFFKLHTKFLVSEVEKLEQVDVETLVLISKAPANKETKTDDMIVIDAEEPMDTNELESKTSDVDTVRMVTSHFIQLAKTGEHVKDVCLSLLRSKVLLHGGEGPLMSAGALNPRGSSVWYKILKSVIEASHS